MEAEASMYKSICVLYVQIQYITYWRYIAWKTQAYSTHNLRAVHLVRLVQQQLKTKDIFDARRQLAVDLQTV